MRGALLVPMWILMMCWTMSIPNSTNIHYIRNSNVVIKIIQKVSIAVQYAYLIEASTRIDWHNMYVAPLWLQINFQSYSSFDEQPEESVLYLYGLMGSFGIQHKVDEWLVISLKVFFIITGILVSRIARVSFFQMKSFIIRAQSLTVKDVGSTMIAVIFKFKFDWESIYDVRWQLF